MFIGCQQAVIIRPSGQILPSAVLWCDVDVVDQLSLGLLLAL